MQMQGLFTIPETVTLYVVYIYIYGIWLAACCEENIRKKWTNLPPVTKIYFLPTIGYPINVITVIVSGILS